jgi:dynein heavy chain
MTELYKLHSFYLYSLESYIFVIKRAVNDVANIWKAKNKIENPVAIEENKDKESAEGDKQEEAKQEMEEEIEEEMTDQMRTQRVNDLKEAITDFSYLYVRRGLFERHKLIFSSLISFKILVGEGQIKEKELQYLIEGKKDTSQSDEHQSTKDYLKDYQIAAVKGLSTLEGFSDFFENLISQSEKNYWFKWLRAEKAEVEELPKYAQNKTAFQKLLIIRALRPDRITAAVTNYIVHTKGNKFVEGTVEVDDTFKETSNKTPIFFVLFPGVDPTLDVERQGEKYGKTSVNGGFINIPMGQGQEEEANRQLEECATSGKWIMLQNVHLMTTWLKKFENDLERVSMDAHEDFRCFISSEPPPLPTMQIIPEPILQSCIKVANEAPQDLKANLVRAWKNFEHRLDCSEKKNEYKAISFGLCFFHSLIIGRKKFGSIGWSRNYNFNEGDLNICADVLKNYLEKYEKVPYEDLRYIYGEIMYGGHITDNWDRRTNNSYLKTLIKPELLISSNLAPGFKSPDPNQFDWEAYKKYIDHKLPTESPVLFGLSQNAEISYNTSQGEYLFDNIYQIQGGKAQSAGSGDDTSMRMIKDFQDQLKQKPSFKLQEIRAKNAVLNPYDVVALQECEKLNYIYFALSRSLDELEQGLTGMLDMTDAMDKLLESIKGGKLPQSWDESAGYPSKKSLGFWFMDLLKRHDQMNEWTKELKLPKCVIISLLCNPMSFVTAVKQVTARDPKNPKPLDDLDIMTEVINYDDTMVKDAPSTGVYVYGMFLQGAKWDDSNTEGDGYLTEMLPKELDPKLPVMKIFAVRNVDKNTLGYYECPVYYTTARGPTYIFTSYLKMADEGTDPNKWVLAGVALILSSDE